MGGTFLAGLEFLVYLGRCLGTSVRSTSPQAAVQSRGQHFSRPATDKPHLRVVQAA